MAGHSGSARAGSAAAAILALVVVLPGLSQAGNPGIRPASDVSCGTGKGSLADAVRSAAPGEAVTLEPGCYTVPARVAVPLDRPEVRIEGPGVTLVGTGSIFEVPEGASLALDRLIISGSRDSAIVNEGHLSVNATTFTDNHSEGDGGAIVNRGGTVVVEASTFTENTSATGSDGGAIATERGTVTVRNSTFAENASGGDGGAIDNENGALTVTNATFFRNTSSRSGGAITSSLAEDDTPADARDAVDEDRHTTVGNSVFYGNKALVGEAVASFDGAMTLSHSVVAGGDGTGCSHVGGEGNLSDARGSRCGEVSVDEGLGRLGALGDNGGVTHTIALLRGNPAIDGGHECTLGSDQRGLPRARSRQNPCDIGAYEANRISVDDVVVLEGDGPCTRVDFPVELDAPALAEVEVTPSASGAQLCESTDVLARRLPTVALAPGADSATITTRVQTDKGFSPTRRIFLEIVDAVNAVPLPGGGRASATIANDDQNRAPIASDHEVTIDEGTSVVAVDLKALVDDAETEPRDLAYALAGDGPEKGTAVLSGSVVTYEPHDARPGDDAFDYRITDEGDPGCGLETCQRPRSARGTVTVSVAASRSPTPSAAPAAGVTSASPAPASDPATAPADQDRSPPSGDPSPSSVLEAAGPDLALGDTVLELVRAGSAAGSSDDVLYAAGADPIVLSGPGDSLRLTTTVFNYGDGDSPPTSITVASPGWAGDSVPVPAVPARSDVAVDGSMPAPPGVTGDTRFVVTIGTVEGEVDPTNNAEPDVVVVVPRGAGDDRSSTREVMVLLVAAVVLAAVAITTRSLIRRKPSGSPRRAPEEDGHAGTRGGDLADLADRWLGADPGAPLTLAGPACRRLHEALHDEGRANPVIATMYWRAFMETPAFSRGLAGLGASAGAIEHPDVLVVPHAGGTRHDLVVLDPGFAQPEPSSGVVDATADELAGAWERLSGRAHESLRGAVGEWPTSMLVQVIAEAASFERFGVVIVPAPPTVPTRCPSPAWPVGGEQEAATSSAGAIVVDSDGRKGVTVADHAVRGYAKVMVNGRIGTVISSDAISDSSFVEVDVSGAGECSGAKGPLRGVSPRHMEVVTFDGMRSGRTTTRVVGWDPTILTVDSYIQNKIVTEPVTVQGDSGAALVDGDGYILGFAFYTTGLNAHPAHSGWIWADSVYRAHGLTPLKDD